MADGPGLQDRCVCLAQSMRGEAPRGIGSTLLSVSGLGSRLMRVAAVGWHNSARKVACMSPCTTADDNRMARMCRRLQDARTVQFRNMYLVRILRCASQEHCGIYKPRKMDV